jgi:hypothetical protein
MVVVLVRCVEQGSGRRGGGVATAVSIGMLYAANARHVSPLAH